MTAYETVILCILIFAAALLYSSVGHGGASGYLAAMALAGLALGVMKPTALSLNVLVALIATVRFYRAGAFSWPIFLQFAAARFLLHSGEGPCLFQVFLQARYRSCAAIFGVPAFSLYAAKERP